MNLRLYYKHLTAKIVSKWTILSIDVTIVIFSTLLAYLLSPDFVLVGFDKSDLFYAVVAAVVVNIFFFHCFKTYVGVIRYSSFIDIVRLLVSLLCAYSLLLALYLLSSLRIILPSFYLFILTAFTLNYFFMICSRISVKLFHEMIVFDRGHSVNTMIYGTFSSGINIAKSLRISKNNHFRLCGFITRRSDLIGKKLMGTTVYAEDENLFRLLEEKDISTIIISPDRVEVLKEAAIVDRLLNLHIKLLSVPPLTEWGKDLLDQNQIKEIQIEDLLQRQPIQVDIRKIATHIEGKRVLITGAAGSIGGEIVRQVVQFNPILLILVDQAETPLHDVRLELQENSRNISAETIVADVTNVSRMEELFKVYRPEYIFHAAAYKHVPMMEDNVSEAVQTNVMGTKILADLSVKYQAEKFVMISTDKAVNPTNVMGCSKRLAEIYVQSLAKKLWQEGDISVKFITTRFGNVLGSNGSVIPRFKDQIAKGGPVTVTHPDIIRYFMTIPEACRLVLEAGSMGNGGEIYIFDMGEPVKILDLAHRMIRLSGRNDVQIQFTGLRHGEKLYEELLNIKEQTKPTYHEKILIADVREYEYDVITTCIEKLIEVSYHYKPMEIVTAMKSIVPEFVSVNSVFADLDAKQS